LKTNTAIKGDKRKEQEKTTTSTVQNNKVWKRKKLGEK